MLCYLWMLNYSWASFTDNQAAWMRDYVPAMEKMLANGYETGLVDAPDFTTGVNVLVAPTN